MALPFLSVTNAPTPPPPPVFRTNPIFRADTKYNRDDLVELAHDVGRLVKAAAEKNVDISKEFTKIHWTFMDGLYVLEQTGTMTEVALIHQVTMRQLYCCQIVRKMTKHFIHNAFDSLAQNPRCKKHLNLINGSRVWVLKQLPPGMYLEPLQKMEKICTVLQNKVKEIQEKIINRK